MTDSDYEVLVDETIATIEDAIDALEMDIDYETAGGILTLFFENDSRIIINRQSPVKQLWVAARSGGFHLNYDEESRVWKTDDIQGKAAQGEELFHLLSRLCTEQASELVKFD